MRVITGTAKGRKLISPIGLDTRPTQDKVKEGIFSAIQFDIEGRRILDLFAGSGQLGIEALSRGADSCIFIDSSNLAINAIKENLKNCNLIENSTVIKTDANSFIATNNNIYDIVFLDPPYKSGLIVEMIEKLNKNLSDYAILICEHSADILLPDEINGFYAHKKYRYGKTAATIFRRKENSNE